MRLPIIIAACIAAAVPSAVTAQTPRELLTLAAFRTTDKTKALSYIDQALNASEKTLAVTPRDREASLQRGIAIGYRARLKRSRSDAKAALAIFTRLAAEDPKDPDAQMVIAGWHLDSIDQLGGFVARTALGARSQAGEAALAKAVSLGGNRAFYPGLAALMDIRRDEEDLGRARRWAEAAASAPAPTTLDAIMKRAAITILPALRSNDGAKAAKLSRRLLPFGTLAD
jgi:hypothetical protein